MQTLARDFGNRQIKLVAMEIDQIADPQKAFPVGLMTKGLDAGFQSMCIPKAYGGLGLDYLTHALMFEEFGAGLTAEQRYRRTARVIPTKPVRKAFP